MLIHQAFQCCSDDARNFVLKVKPVGTVMV